MLLLDAVSKDEGYDKKVHAGMYRVQIGEVGTNLGFVELFHDRQEQPVHLISVPTELRKPESLHKVGQEVNNVLYKPIHRRNNLQNRNKNFSVLL